jgi:undecaprenyl-diphosphatase
MDDAVTQWINSAAGQSALLDTIMISLTQYGVPLLVLLVVLQWWSKHDRLQVRHTCIAAGLSFIVGLGLNQVILLFIHRVRPYDAGVSHLIISRSSDWSFPSDHATVTFAIAGAFLLHGSKWRGLALLAGAFLVCTSRIYVGTHYFTDVLGGAMTGILAAAAVRGLYWEGTRVDRLITGIL